ncbi:hypothetical protein N7466_002870 [Penicillium verhagenii]|uniref:uncharacterized protein n=1 Tax=Penicillium verhagenii TaxID=1562060 RepID=UPI0025450218|nr:uncharacterized protein N7466_002870 [Penicillium verhagenii]KAJ5939736.1 hypothetical protein N7466_002870 [Penicillium verhagenii]
MSEDFPPCAALPVLTLHPSVNPEQLDAAKVVADSLAKRQADDINDHFLEKESWCRDFISFSWDIACHNGAETISEYLSSSKTGFRNPKANQPGAMMSQLANLGPMQFIQSGFSFETDVGVGRGVLRLASIGPDQWKAWTIFTTLEHLKEQEAETQPRASLDSMQVLIVGAGHSGLYLAAHLQELGLKYLIVDKASRVGDAWRTRYDTIKLHTPTETGHYPFLKYTSDSPRYLDKEDILKWMEHYQQTLDLKVRYETLARNIEYNESTQQWSVELQTNGSVEKINPKHVVLATGVFSDIPIRPDLPGEKLFKGQIYHTLTHKTATSIPDLQNKKVTIIGAGTSAHDVAQDFVNHGVGTVTMVQRSSMFTSLWNTPGVSTEDADLLANSLPTAVVRTLGLGMTQMITANDKAMLDGLEKAGLAVKRDEGENLLDYLLVNGGHFYFDQGASQMIIDGRIKVQRCEQGVQGFDAEGIILGDGTKIQSDIVILATGVHGADKMIEQIVAKEFMDKVGDVASLDDSQERKGVWRPTGVPGFWFMAGNFVWSRQFAPVLALQIAAVERALRGYESPE